MSFLKFYLGFHFGFLYRFHLGFLWCFFKGFFKVSLGCRLIVYIMSAGGSSGTHWPGAALLKC